MNPKETLFLAIESKQLAKLKLKCLIAMVGLLEASDHDEHLLLRMIRVIPLKVLTENLLYTYILYEKFKTKDEYDDSLFNRYD